MDPNNSEFIVEDELNESNFSDVSSSIGMDPKEMVEKIRKLENMIKKNSKGSNNVGQSGMVQMIWQMGEKFGKMEIKIDGISKENVELKDGMAKMMKAFEELKKANEEKDKEMEEMKMENANGMAKIVQAFEELKKTNGIVIQLIDMVYELKDENEEKGREMEEMKKAIEELKMAKQKENRAFEELKEENGRKLSEFDELIANICGKNAEMMEGKILENGRKIEEFETAFNGLKNGIDGKNAELEGIIAGLKEEEEKLKEKMREMQGQIGEMTKLTEKIDGIEWVKYDWNAFKIGAKKFGQKSSEGGLVTNYSGPNYTWKCIRANWPIQTLENLRSIIKKPTFAFYFEMEILNKPDGSNCIGFCDQQFQLEIEGKGFGDVNANSIGIGHKGGIYIGGSLKEFGKTIEWFKKGDVVGIGLIYYPNSKMECFATCNGELLGKVEIPPKFANCQLYPAIYLYYAGESVRVKFDKDNCQFKEFECALQ